MTVNEITPEMIEAAQNKLWWSGFEVYDYTVKDVLTAALAAAPAPQPVDEPVAWFDPKELEWIAKHRADPGENEIDACSITAAVRMATGAMTVPLYTAPPAPQPVAVKPLEWVEPFPEIIEAETQFGYSYRIYQEYGRSDGKKIFAINCISGSFLSIEEAKAAAQADYEQRIRSALVSAPPAEIDRLKAENERLRNMVEKLDCEVQP